MANKKITDLMSGTPVRDSLLESAIDISGTMDSRKVKAGAVADLASANVAAPYDTTVTYAIGQYCLYEGDIYRCIAITTGAFDSTAWVQIVVTGEFRRVVELTSAQYTALSSAEKNNGTLYIITDEETTADDIPVSDSDSTSIAEAIEGLSAVSRFSATGSVYGGFSCKAINGVKCISVDSPKGLAVNALTTLDFTLPKNFRPIDGVRYFDIRQPSDNYTIRLIIRSDGTVQIYNYGTSTGTLNMSFTGCYI